MNLRRTPHWALLTGALLFLSACGTDLQTGDELAGTNAHLGDDAVTVIDSGHWRKILACSGICVSDYHFWVDLRVRNDGFHKNVGIHWSDSGWSSVKVAPARFERSLGDGYELWGVDVFVGQAQKPPTEIVFAAFAQMGGTTHWDRHNNHFIYKSVLPSRPVVLVDSKPEFIAEAGAQVSGTIRTWDFGPGKQVSVIYTTDGWKTVAEAPATFAGGHDWAFKTGILGSATSLPDEIKFAVRYAVDGREYWDNNGGADFGYALRPKISVNGGNEDTSRPVSGVLTYQAFFQSSLPVASSRSRLDAQPWVDGTLLIFSTDGLADGQHTLTFEVTLEGGFVQQTSFPIVVKNRIQPLGGWAPAPPNPVHTVGYPWDAAIGPSGSIYVIWDDYGVTRHDAYGSTTAPFVYSTIQSAQSLTVDASERLYVLASHGPSTGIHRFLPDGQLDTTWGLQGVVSLNGTFAGSSICYPGFLAALGNEVLLSDTCNSRVLRFDAQGSFADALNFAEADGITQSISVSGNTAYIAQSKRVTAAQVKAGALQAVSHLEIADGVLGGIRATWWSTDGNLWSLSNNRLVVIDAQGQVQAEWQGGSEPGFVGAFPLARAMLQLPDGTFAVLSTDAKRFERFSQTLR